MYASPSSRRRAPRRGVSFAQSRIVGMRALRRRTSPRHDIRVPMRSIWKVRPAKLARRRGMEIAQPTIMSSCTKTLGTLARSRSVVLLGRFPRPPRVKVRQRPRDAIGASVVDRARVQRDAVRRDGRGPAHFVVRTILACVAVGLVAGCDGGSRRSDATPGTGGVTVLTGQGGGGGSAGVVAARKGYPSATTRPRCYPSELAS
jgi:hypothetical protein